MEVLKYTVIKNVEQYNSYCEMLIAILETEEQIPAMEDEIDLLTLLIEKYDEEHNTFSYPDPIQLLKSFMTDHQLSATALAGLLKVSKGYVSDILNYKKGLSKDVIRKLADHFKVRQDAFNRHYELKLPDNEKHAGFNQKSA
jgi:HTH-type transcriptional regulator/antitoxin HigA